MTHSNKVAVTGAFGYSGKYITRILLTQEKQVITLTGHPQRPNPFGKRVVPYPYNFENPAELTRSLAGVDVLYNTYWVRFAYGQTTFEQTVENSRALFRAAVDAGVRRIVHVSITNPSLRSTLPYFHGKALLEQAIIESGLSYAILRPTVLFGKEDILINNIAYLLRRSPLFVIPGSGEYRLQPIFVGDLAEIAVREGESEENTIIDAIGPETFTFNELVRLLAGCVGSRSRLVHLPPGIALFLSRLMGFVLNDVVLTDDEVKGLMENRLVTDSPPAGSTSLRDWLKQNAHLIGIRYASELARHYRSNPGVAA